MTVRNRMEPTSHSKSNINNYSSSSSSVDDGSIAYIEPGSAALALATMHIAGSRKMGSHSSNFNNDENGGVASTSTTAAPASSTMTTTIVNLSEHISASGSAAEDAAGDVDDCGGVKRKRGGRNRQFSDEQRKVRNRIAQAAHRKKKNNYMAELVNLCTNRKEAGVALRDRLQICSSALFHTRSALSRALHLLELIKTNEASRKRTSVGTNSSDERLSSISSDFDEVDWINAMVGERQTIASYINLSETISTGDLDKEKAEDEKLMRFASSILEEEPKPLSLISNNNEDEEQSTSFTTFSNYVSSTSRYSSKSTTLNARVENDGRAIVTRSSTRKSNYSLRSRSESINSSSSSLPDGAVGRYGPSKYDRTVEEEVVEAAVVHKVPQIVEAAATTIKDKPSRVSRSLSQDSSSLSGANATGLAYCSSSPLSQKSSSILSPPSPPQLTLTTTTTATTSSTTASQKHIVETLSTQAVMEMDFPEKLSETGQQHSDVTTKINSVDKTRSAAEAVAATLVVGGVNTVPLTENLPASKPTANRSSSLSSVKTTTTTNSTPTTSYGSISTTNSSLYSAFPAFSSSHSSPSLTELEAASSLLSYSQPPPTSSTIISALTSNPTDEKNATDHFLAQISNIRRSFLEGELVDQQYPHHHHNSFLPHHHSRNQHLHQQFSIEPVLDRNGSNVALASSSSVAMAAPYQNSFHPPHHHHQPSHYTQTRFISTTPCPHQHNNNRNHHAQLLNHQQLEHRGGGEEAGSNHMFVDDVRNFIPSPHNYLDYMPPPPPQPHSTQFDFRQPPSNSSSSSSDGAVVAAAVAALAHHQQQQDYNHHQIMMVGGIPLPQPAPYPAHLDFEYQQRRGGDVGGMNQYAPCGGGGALPVTSAQQNFCVMIANQQRTFKNSFWGEGDKGLEVLMGRMKNAKHICEEVLNVVRERAAIEEDYGKRLMKLAKAVNTKEEIGSLRDSLEVVKVELEVSARSHMDLANEIKSQLDKPLQEFMATQSGIRKNHQANMEKQLKTKATLSTAVIKSKERYEAKCMETNQLIQMRQATLPPKEADKIKQKLEKAQSLANQSDFDYMNGVEKLADTHKKWEEDFKTCCADSQKLEEDRIDFLRSHLWNYANLLSTVCVADDESCERIRVSLEKCDIEKDIQLFLDKNATGSEIPPPMQYVNFYTGGKDRSGSEPVSQPSAAPNLKQSGSMTSSRSSISNNPFGAPPQSRGGSVVDNGFAPIQDNTANAAAIAETMYGPILGGPGFGPSGGVGVGNRDAAIENKRMSHVGGNKGLPGGAGGGMKNAPAESEEGYFHYDPYEVDEKSGVLFQVKVLYDYQSQAFEELDITKGQIVPVIATHDDGWWEGIIQENGRKRKGLFPSNFVETI